MENFEKWFNEAVDADLDKKRKDLARWVKNQVETHFNVHVADFSMDIDKFIPAFGVQTFDLLKKYNLLKIEDQGPKRFVKFNFTYNRNPDKERMAGSKEVECKNCGQPGKLSDPKCWVCGASGPTRFEPRK